MVDSLETIKCPACGKDMAKIYMPDAGVNIDICVDGCGGIYFDNREFKDFDEKNENIENIEKALAGKTFTEVDDNQERICPNCGMVMQKNFASAKHAVQIDECYGCGAKFLDHNELSKIREEYETEKDRADDVVGLLYESVGVELKELDIADAKRRARGSSPLKKVFDGLMNPFLR